MCGIFALLNYNEKISGFDKNVYNEFKKGKQRGPEFSLLKQIQKKTLFGFHRLSINGLNERSNQPLYLNHIVLICNGEIYNYKQLYELMNIKPNTESDCEVIAHLYNKYGITQTLNMLDGVFAFILCDLKKDEIYCCRDPYGVRPLYSYKDNNNNVGFASEVKCLTNIYSILNVKNYIIDHSDYKIKHFIPGTYSVLKYSNDYHSNSWNFIVKNTKYIVPSFPYEPLMSNSYYSHQNIYSNISYLLTQSVNKRCITTERPIACLLSGGLDSSLITALVNDCLKKTNSHFKLNTYSIGLKGATDLKYAKIVADYLGTNHTEIIVTEKEMIDIIPKVIYALETYDTTTIRASIGNYLIGKYIKDNSDAKVIFNGDGSDELFGGYLYMKKCPDDIEFDKESRKLLKNIHMFDVIRSDKCISSHGLEPRTPFLDKTFTNYCLSIPPHLRNHNNTDVMEKHLLRQSFAHPYYHNFQGNSLLPDEVLWRSKEAFSDGVSGKERSLFEILQNHISCKLNEDNYFNIPFENGSTRKQYESNIETEKMYYKTLFDNNFPNCSNLVPYLWMPNFTNSTIDPSARTLDIYN